MSRKNYTEFLESNTQLVWYGRFKQLFASLFAVYVLTISAFIVVAIISRLKKIPIAYLTRDPAAILGQPFYIGLLSNIGILLWCSCAAICIFSFFVLKKDIKKKESKFLLFSGLLSSILLIDDLLMVHEDVFPNYLHISEKLFFLGYAVILSLYLINFVETIVKTDFIILILAFAFFGMSIVSDTLFSNINNNYMFLFEDGAKLLGIVTWFIYFARVCMNKIKYNQNVSSLVVCKTKLS
ncbi:hypothetical protein [Fischerella sp. PCC 9605]|uniref:hypothetical protein n=1 Tax=Fischerella sp. PCC 9605 TaxID=1173024 RepID=UPI0004B1AF94|nr:hypothetical protein [Fischerella sp. PCC 9605]